MGTVHSRKRIYEPLTLPMGTLPVRLPAHIREFFSLCRAKRKRLKPDCSGLTHIGPLVFYGGSPLLMLIFELSIYPKLFKHCLATADRRRADVSVCVAMSHLSSVVSENQFNVENGQFSIK